MNFMSVADIDWNEAVRVGTKIRYNHKGAWCTVETVQVKTKFYVHLMNRQRAITPGQALVLYDGEYVLGGGTIL